MSNFTKDSPILGFLMVMTMVIIIIAGLKAASPLLTPLILALFLATLSASIINFFVSKGIPRLFTKVAVILFVIIFIAGLGTLLTASASEFSSKLPLYISKLDTLVEQGIISLGLEHLEGAQQFKEIYHPGHLLSYSLIAATSIGGVLSKSILIMMTITFMLIQRKSFINKITYLTQRDDAYEHFRRLIKNVDHYFLILTFISMLTAISVYIVLLAFDVDFALMWALAAFFLNFIPNIGSFIAALPPILITLIDQGVLPALYVTLLYIMINFLFGNLLLPRYVGKGVDLSILVVFLSMLFWGWIFGPVGMLLSVPLTIIFKVVFESFEQTRWIAVMLGNDPYERRL